jgi:hypothetical protein
MNNPLINIVYDDRKLSIEAETNGLILCDAIAGSIIENYSLLGMHLCTECGNNIYGNSFGEEPTLATPQDIIAHIHNHYRNNGYTGLGGVYICNVCAAEFQSQDALTNHKNTSHNFRPRRQPVYRFAVLNMNQHAALDMNQFLTSLVENIDATISMQIDRTNQYQCPVCSRGFRTQLNLGAHFLSRHNDYAELSSLDKRQNDGFPGFEVLQKIKMMRFIIEGEVIESNTCVLCCFEYDHCIRGLTDCDLMKPLNDKFKHYNDDMKLIYMTKIEKSYKYPLELLCCNNHICSECLKKHINESFGDPKCPFCRKSHTQTDKRFIIFDERPKHKILSDPDPYPLILKNDKCDVSESS